MLRRTFLGGAAAAAAAPFLPPVEAPPPRDAPGPFAFADGQRIERILWAAGFRDVAVKPMNFAFFMGATLEEAADQAMGMGPPAMAAADDATRAKIRLAILAKAKDYLQPQGVTPPAAIWLVSARA